MDFVGWRLKESNATGGGGLSSPLRLRAARRRRGPLDGEKKDRDPSESGEGKKEDANTNVNANGNAPKSTRMDFIRTYWNRR